MRLQGVRHGPRGGRDGADYPQGCYDAGNRRLEWGWTMTETMWDRFLPRNYGGADWNARMFGLGPLDRPGSDDYFRSVMNSARRQVEARNGFKVPPVPKSKRTAFRVTRTGVDALSPQRCEFCSRPMSHEPCKAFTLYPAVVCLTCAPRVETRARWQREHGSLVEGRIA